LEHALDAETLRLYDLNAPSPASSPTLAQPPNSATSPPSSAARSSPWTSCGVVSFIGNLVSDVQPLVLVVLLILGVADVPMNPSMGPPLPPPEPQTGSASG